MTNLTINMTDIMTGKEIIRTVDISVIYVNGASCWEVAKSESKQRELIEGWIEDRANAQHDTSLELNEWTVH